MEPSTDFQKKFLGQLLGRLEGLERHKAIGLLHELRTAANNRTHYGLLKQALLKHNPVTLRVFVEDRDFLDMKGVVYPKVLDALEEMNNGSYVEAILTGAIGTGKTTIALISQAYQLYLLSCYSDPHALYMLDPSSEILFVFQNLSLQLAKDNDYNRFRAMIEKSPYFRSEFPYVEDIVSELRFPNRVIVRPIAASESGAIGQNVFGGMLDEVNSMEVIDRSKRAIDGGVYDQAKQLYETIARRRESRFMIQGQLPGIVCLVSSRKYPGQMTDRKEEQRTTQIKRTGRTTIYLYDKRTWEVVPQARFTGKWFNMFVGDEHHKPRILEVDEKLPEDQLKMVWAVPEVFRKDFEDDPMNAIRDILGLSTLARFPFLTNREKVAAAFTRELKSLVSRDVCDFTDRKLALFPGRIRNGMEPRWAHIDLGVTGDSAGLVIGYVDKFIQIQRGETTIETLPHFTIDLALEIAPPKGAEILFFKIRALLYKLKEHGLNIKWVSFDSFQSTDSLQILQRKGFMTGVISVDATTVPYDTLKTALYDGRVAAHEHDKLLRELNSLERDPKTKKIDHPAHGSKDVADALAASVHGLTMRREVWARHDVPLLEIPMTVQQIMVSSKDPRAAIEEAEDTGLLVSA